jgi:hypothetical protein
MKLLTHEQIEVGFTIEEDDHCLYLLLRNDRVATFGAIGTTKEVIQETADTIHAQKMNEERR